MSKLIHYTELLNKDSLKRRGLTRKHEYIKISGKATDDINVILNKYKPVNKYPSNLINREDCLFFTFKSDNVGPDCFRGLTVEVDMKDLDENNLFVAPFTISSYLGKVINIESAESLQLYSRHYWGNCFPIADYINNKNYIQSVFERLYNTFFIPEVLYMGEVEPSKLTVYVPTAKAVANLIKRRV